MPKTSTQARNACERKIAAARRAREGRVPSVAFLGRGGGALAGLVDQAIIVDSLDTSLIQLIHLALEHLIVEMVERELLKS